MRKIKFRAWDKFNETHWCQGDSETVDEFFIRLKCIIEGGNNLIFEQFTGLLDKNGKEIYEGDIVDSDNFDLVVCFLSNYKYETSVDENDGEHYYVYLTGFFGHYKDKSGYSTLHNELEVIGNIYENPELV